MTPSNRPTLILLPGHLCPTSLWQSACDDLADLAECHSLPLDDAASITDMAASVLARAPRRFALAGLSMGGYVALQILRMAPERVSHLALVDTSARADAPGRVETRLADLRRSEHEGLPALARELPARWLHPAHAADPRLSQFVIEGTLAVGLDAQRRQQLALMTRVDSRPGLGAITCPTLVACGAQDLATPVEVHQEMAALIPGARLVVIEQCGHLAPIEQPAALNRALRDWLRR